MTVKLTNAQIAWRAAQDIDDGAYVNLGFGFPELVAGYQPAGRQAIFHTSVHSRRYLHQVPKSSSSLIVAMTDASIAPEVKRDVTDRL